MERQSYDRNSRVMTNIVLTVNRVLDANGYFVLRVNESIKGVKSHIDSNTGEVVYVEEDVQDVFFHAKYILGYLATQYPGFAFLYGKRKEKDQNVTATDLSVYLRNAEVTIKQTRYTSQDTYLVNEEELHYNGVCYRNEIVNIKVTERVEKKFEELEDRAFME